MKKNNRKEDFLMKELVLTQKEVILLPTFDEQMMKCVMEGRLKEKGFDLTRSINKRVNYNNGDIIYTQK